MKHNKIKACNHCDQSLKEKLLSAMSLVTIFSVCTLSAYSAPCTHSPDLRPKLLHTQEHHFVTYRDLPKVLPIAVLLTLLQASQFSANLVKHRFWAGVGPANLYF